MGILQPKSIASGQVKNTGKTRAYTFITESLKLGFLTGSRAFGTANPDSDWDVCVPTSSMMGIRHLATDKKSKPDTIEESGYNRGIKYTFNIDDKSKMEINIIPVHPVAFKPWWLATKSIAAALPALLRDGVRPHQYKALFESFVCQFRMVILEKPPSAVSSSNSFLMLHRDSENDLLRVKKYFI